MKIEYIPAKNLKTSNWTSGTTTEIFIYPKESSFLKRDFQFRISRATVEAKATDFTKFIGITRSLMVLEGTLQLKHNEEDYITLKPFEQNSFSGEWETKSKGKVSDFNLMTNSSTNGTLESVFMKKSEKYEISLSTDMAFMYVAKGQIKFENESLQESDSLIFSELLGVNKICLLSESEEATIIVGKIQLNQ